MSRISTSLSVSRLGVLVTLSLVWSSVFPRVSEAADPTSDNALCKRLWEDHLEAAMALQPERLVFAKEAVLIYPDQVPLRGRDAIQSHLKQAFAGLKSLKVGFKIDRCEVVGARAYAFATLDEEIQEGAAPPASRLARSATVWEQQPDKTWQVAYSLVNYLKP
jgi:ketosteroid isomerase-like protein